MNNEGYKEDYYFVLGVREDASQEEIQAAYRRLMKQFHSDLNRGNSRAHERGKLINEANDVLKDPAQRRAYDDWLRQSGVSSGPYSTGADAGADNRREQSNASHGPYEYEGRSHQGHPGGTQQQAGATLDPSAILERWYLGRSGVERRLAPDDFLAATESTGHQASFSDRVTTDRLGLRVSERSEEVTKDRWVQYEPEPQKLQHVPDEFRKCEVTAVVSSQIHDCGPCAGRGRTDCPPMESCPVYARCRSCRGEGVNIADCATCDGDGYKTYETQTFDTRKRRCRSCGGTGEASRRRCAPCGGNGQVVCDVCGGMGEVHCRHCGGLGYLDCERCGTHGKLLTALMVTRKFAPRQDVVYHGMDNGLSARHFSDLVGQLVDEQWPPPDTQGDVRQRQRIERFPVDSFSYAYGERHFFVNVVHDVNGRQKLCGPARLPLSEKTRQVLQMLAIATGVIALAVVAFLVLWPMVSGA